MANIYDLTDTWSDGNTTYTSIKMNVTNTASSAASKLIDLQVGSSSLFSVDKDGKIADATELQVDNVKLDGNTVSSTTGNLVLDPYSGSKISLDGLLWPNADGTANQMLQTDGAGNLSWGTPAAGYSNSDVDTHLNTSSATTNQVLSWNGSDYAWTAQTGGSSYGDSDVDTHLNRSTATTGQLLSWNGSDYDWITSSAGGGSYADSDVDAHLNRSTASTGEVLSWNGSDYDWVANSGGSSYTDADVDTHLNQSSATTGQVLQWDGSDYAWVAQTAAYTDADVDTHLNRSSASSGQILSYNGSDYAWIPDAGITDVVSDTTPQLGGNLDLNNSNVTGTGNINITGTITTTMGGSVVPFYFADQSAFPSASTYHGAIAHSHADAAMYYAHGGNWHKLADTTAATTSAAGLMAAADKTKLDGIEASADVTDATNVTAAGALMDSELASEAAVKAINQQLTTTSDVAFNDLALAGDLQVNGTTTTVGTTNLAVADSLIELSNGFTGTPVNDAGIVIERGTGDNAFIGWDESDDKFVLGTGTFVGTDTGNLTITKGDVALGTLTTAVGGTDVDVRRAKVETPTTSADFAGDARLYNVATTGLTFTMDDTALNAGDIITLYANGYDVTIAQDATNGFDTVKLDGTTTAHSGNITVANGSIATISVISTTGGSSLAVVAGQGLS